MLSEASWRCEAAPESSAVASAPQHCTGMALFSPQGER